MVKVGKHTFTIIEYCLALGLVGFFVFAALLLANPRENSAVGRDAQRQIDVARIADALMQKNEYDRTQYLGRDSAPAMLLAAPAVQVIVSDDAGIVCNDPAKAPSCGAAVLDTSGPHKRCVANLAGLIPGYFSALPVDPLGEAYEGAGLPLGAKNTGYYIRMLPGGRIEIGACANETGGAAKVMK